MLYFTQANISVSYIYWYYIVFRKRHSSRMPNTRHSMLTAISIQCTLVAIQKFMSLCMSLFRQYHFLFHMVTVSTLQSHHILFIMNYHLV